MLFAFNLREKFKEGGQFSFNIYISAASRWIYFISYTSVEQMGGLLRFNSNLLSVRFLPIWRLQSFWRELSKRSSILIKIHFVKFETTLTTLRLEQIPEQIFANLSINRENKLCETYKILSNLENLLCKIWGSFNSRKRNRIGYFCYLN